MDGYGNSFFTEEGNISIVNPGMVTTLICKAKGVLNWNVYTYHNYIYSYKYRFRYL